MRITHTITEVSINTSNQGCISSIKRSSFNKSYCLLLSVTSDGVDWQGAPCVQILLSFNSRMNPIFGRLTAAFIGNFAPIYGFHSKSVFIDNSPSKKDVNTLENGV